jgi:hypothetical protein
LSPVSSGIALAASNVVRKRESNGRNRCHPDFEEIEIMMKAVGVLAFAAMMLVAGVTEVPAVAFNSISGQGSCELNGCVGGWVAISPDPAWQGNNPGILNASPAVWISYADTGEPRTVTAPNTVVTPLNSLNATERFTISIPAGFNSLSLLVWADDTAGVRLDGSLVYQPSTTPGASAPNETQGANCAAGGLTCTPGGGAAFHIALTGLAGQFLTFDTFQRGGDAFGLLYQGELELAPVPEPATMLLVGSVLAGVGFISRRRLQKTQD